MEADREAFADAVDRTRESLDAARREALEYFGSLPSGSRLAEMATDAVGLERYLADLDRFDVGVVGLAALAVDGMRERDAATRVVEAGPWTIYFGTAEFAETTHLTAPFIFLGDLVIDGVFRDAGPDSTIVIVGDLHARGVETTGNLLVLGNVDATVIRGVYNDESLVVAGDVQARFIDENDHAVELCGAVAAEHHFELGRSDEEATADASVFLRPDLLDVELDEIHWSQLFKDLAAGVEIFAASPQPRQDKEPDAPTEAELDAYDERWKLDEILAKARVPPARKDIVFASQTTGECWFRTNGSGPFRRYDGDSFASSKLIGEGPRAVFDSQPRADERHTFWRKRGDFFVEIERFGVHVFAHIGVNNGTMTTFPSRWESPEQAAAEVAKRVEGYGHDLVRITSEIPGRGLLERELSRYGESYDDITYTSAVVDGQVLRTRTDGERRCASEEEALDALEEWLAEKRAAGFDLKVLEWKPFGFLAA